MFSSTYFQNTLNTFWKCLIASNCRIIPVQVYLQVPFRVLQTFWHILILKHFLKFNSWQQASLTLMMVRVWVGLVWLIILGLMLWGEQDLSWDFCLLFPIALVNFLNKVSESVERARFVKVYHFILDPLWEGKVCHLVECFIVVLKKWGKSVKVNKNLGSLVIVLHDKLF